MGRSVPANDKAWARPGDFVSVHLMSFGEVVAVVES
jgi:hypothetical protein